MSQSVDNLMCIIGRIDKLASSIEEKGLFKEAENLDVVSNTLDKMAKIIPAGDDRPAAIFPSTHPKVNDDKDHYPIPDKVHGKNALGRLSEFKGSKPSWWDGTPEELKNTILRAVKEKFPSMNVDDKKFI